jgi:predicted amidophosphoribosyltransferase
MKSHLTSQKKVFEGLKTLVFPQICIMCAATNEVICSICLQKWSGSAQKIRFDSVPTFSTVAYDGEISTVVIKAKEERNKTAQALIALAITSSLSSLKEEVNIDNCLLVPIPSSKQAIKRRGESFLHPIMKRVIKLDCQSKTEYRSAEQWAELLSYRKKVRDQATLSSVERHENLRSAFIVSRFLDRPVILVDDVVTTGATLKNAIDALRERKMTVLGAVTACASAHQLLIR